MYIEKRENPIVNRLNKTKAERQVDHEEERQERVKRENAVKRAAAAAQVCQRLYRTFVGGVTECQAWTFRNRLRRNSLSNAGLKKPPDLTISCSRVRTRKTCRDNLFGRWRMTLCDSRCVFASLNNCVFGRICGN